MTEQTDRLNTALAGREQTFASGAMATATGLSALQAAVVIGKPTTNVVFSLKARRESTVREGLKRLRQTKQANQRTRRHILHRSDSDERSSDGTTMNRDTIS